MGEARKVAGAATDQNKEAKKDVTLAAQKAQRTVHFATLTDICHLENAELEPTYQQYEGRVVLRGDCAKDDPGSHAAFSEQGSTASQMTTTKVMNVVARLPDCAGDKQPTQHPLALK